MAIKVPEFVLTQGFLMHKGPMDTYTIPEGSFVKPIEYCYVPQHVKDANKHHDKLKEIFCYTREGIVSIPRNIIREIVA
jgi:hypothetical protein